MYWVPRSEWWTRPSLGVGGDRHVEGVEDQLGSHVARHRPADDEPAEHVDDDRDVQEARPGRDVRDVGHPQPIRARRRKFRLTRSGAGPHRDRGRSSGWPAGGGRRPGRPPASAGRPACEHVAYPARVARHGRAARHRSRASLAWTVRIRFSSTASAIARAEGSRLAQA